MGCICQKQSKIKILNHVLATDDNEIFHSRNLETSRLPNNSMISNSPRNSNLNLSHDNFSKNIFSPRSSCGDQESYSFSMNDLSEFVVHKTNNIYDDYLIGKSLRADGAGCIRTASHRPTKQDRLIKVVPKSNLTLDSRLKSQIFSEVDILRQTDHPNIIRLFEFYEDSQNYYLVMEWLKGNDLLTYINNNRNEKIVAYFFKQVLSGVAYLHRKGVIHRNLNPDHLLLELNNDKSVLKIIDFGSASFVEPSKRLSRRYGVTAYTSPEMLKRSYTVKSDIWSCGVILYQLLSGTLPFSGDSENEIVKQIMRGKPNFESESWHQVSTAAKVLVLKLLNPDESQRISAEQALTDAWIEKNSGVLYDGRHQAVSIFNNLKKFHAHEQIQLSILTFIATQLLQKEETRELSEIFRSIDSNSDGKISKEELLKAYAKNRPVGQAKEEVQKIMDEVDLDKSGYIDYTEFIIATMKKEKLLSKKNIENSFKLFDKDGSGSISLAELKSFLGNRSEGSWAELMKTVDKNNDGELSFEEFKELIFTIFS